MLQIHVLDGTRAGEVFLSRRLPFTIGRDFKDALRLPDPGVWGGHLEIWTGKDHRVQLRVHEKALAQANHQPFQDKPLMNGDLVEIGAVKLRIWLSPTVQYPQRSREILFWLCLVLLGILEIGILYWLIH